MKKLFTLCLLAFNLVNGQCEKIQKEVDKFSTRISYSTPKVTLDLLGSFIEFNMIKDQDAELFYLYSKITGVSDCLTSESYITFLFDDKSTMKIYYSGDIRCGVTVGDFNITREDLSKLSNKTFTDFKIHFNDNSEEMSVNTNKYLKIKKFIDCLLSKS